MMDHSHISLPESYSYEGPLSHEIPPNSSYPKEPTGWYVEMEEMHYEDVIELCKSRGFWRRKEDRGRSGATMGEGKEGMKYDINYLNQNKRLILEKYTTIIELMFCISS